METRGKACWPLGDDIEELASRLRDRAASIKSLGWTDQAREMEETVPRLESIGRQVASGDTEISAIAAYLHTNDRARGPWVRRCMAALLILLGTAALIAMRLNEGEDGCEANVAFYLRGTHSDCMVREPASPPPVDQGPVMVGQLD